MAQEEARTKPLSRSEREALVKDKAGWVIDAIELSIAIVLIVVTVIGLAWGTYEFIDYCKLHRCGS
jgi:hypothetical protein